MIKTYHNFKQWIKKHYPDIMITPVYGTGAYTLNKALNDIDMFLYNVQQLPSGQYIVWPGLTPEQVMEQYKSIVQNGVPTRPEQAIPSTFTSFEAWITKHQLKPLHRTHVTGISAAEALHDTSLEKVKRNWYLYEFSLDPARMDGANELFATPLVTRAPYVFTESGSIVIAIKTSNSGYVSKKQLFLQKFATMQPLLEQAIAACAKNEIDRAAELLSQYASIQFGQQMVVADKTKMKEAYDEGIITLYARSIANFELEASDSTF